MRTTRLCLGPIALVAALGACSVPQAMRRPKPHAQVLHLDAAAPGTSRLCSYERASDGTTREVDCAVWTGDSLPTGSLTLDVVNATPGTSYDARVGQASAGASPEDVGAVLAEVARRVQKLVTTAAGAEGEKAVAAVAAALDNAAPLIARKLRADAAQDAAASRRPDAATIFRGFVSGGALKSAATIIAAARAAGTLDLALNEDTTYAPPPRYYLLDASDTAYLATQSVPAAAVTTLVTEWCTGASFQDASRAEVYAAIARPPDTAALAAALDLSAEDAYAIALGRSTSAALDQRLGALVEEEHDKPWAAVSPAARAFFLMRHGTTLVARIDTCLANLRAVAVPAPTDLQALRGHAAAHARALLDVLGPTLKGGLARVEKTVTASGNGTLGTFPLEPGAVDVAFGATVDGTHRELAAFKADVDGMPRFSLVIGPAMTVCRSSWRCFDELQEFTDDRGRGVARHREHRSYSLATALHINLLGWRRHGLGAVVGYPIGTPSDTKYNILLGVGWRHRAGFEVAVGAHVFQTPDLKAPFDAATPLYFEGSRAALSVDQLVHDELRTGVFVLIGFEPTLFAKL